MLNQPVRGMTRIPLPDFVLGIDGGGTKTSAAIVKLSGQLAGTGQAGPSNYDDVGAEAAEQNISAAIQQARAQAGLDDRPFAGAFFGMAGIVTERDRSAIREIARSLAVADMDRVGIDHDCRIALAGGLSGRPGIVLITGTGSSCYGRNAAGEAWLSGGWGHWISDEGSGYWLGLQAMRVASMVDDGRMPYSTLYDAVQGYLHMDDLRDLMHRMYVDGMSRSEIAAMAPLVIDAARAGDPAAVHLLEQGGKDLAECVLAVARRLNMLSAGCEIVQTGGLINAGEIYLQPVWSAILERIPNARISLPELPPVLGACLLAMQNIGVKVDKAITQSLQQTCTP